jgi:hypothetical protein
MKAKGARKNALGLRLEAKLTAGGGTLRLRFEVGGEKTNALGWRQERIEDKKLRSWACGRWRLEAYCSIPPQFLKFGFTRGLFFRKTNL